MPHDETDVDDWCDQIKQYDDDYWAWRQKEEEEENPQEPDDPDYVYERDLSEDQILWYRRSKNHDLAILLLEQMQLKLITGEQKLSTRSNLPMLVLTTEIALSVGTSPVLYMK